MTTSGLATRPVLCVARMDKKSRPILVAALSQNALPCLSR
jgi:hypothetical protein